MTAVCHPQLTDRQQTDLLWARYRADDDSEARAQLLTQYLGLVHHVARAMVTRTPAMDVDELVSAGTFGLIQALESFDLSRGLAFSTYAVRRIRGAILDELRSRDWAPRSTRVKRRHVAGAVLTLQERLGRAPRAREVAEELGVPLDTYWTLRDESAGRTVVSFESDAAAERPGSLTLEELIEDPDAPAPDHHLSIEERRETLGAALAALPERERMVLALYYYEELNLRQIAEVLHVTESRVSQIRSKALRRLRDSLGRREG